MAGRELVHVFIVEDGKDDIDLVPGLNEAVRKCKGPLRGRLVNDRWESGEDTLVHAKTIFTFLRYPPA